MQINIYINHWGKFQMRLCPLSDPSTATELSELSDTCLDKVRPPVDTPASTTSCRIQ